MDISVIVLTYNQEKSIEDAIKSVLAQQTESQFEIIIGDDCSTDSTDKICRKYATLYPDKIRYVRRPRNLGVVQNYFECFSIAKGKYIADCSGDDCWIDPLKLQRQFDVMENNPDVSLVTNLWETKDEKSNRIFFLPKICSLQENMKVKICL